MEPLTTIALASSIIKTLGLDQAVGRWFGGDKGAEMASKVIDVATVVTQAGSSEDILQTLQAQPEKALELRIQMLQMADKEAERDYADRVSARNMQIAALQQDDTFSKRFIYYFAIAWSAFAMIYIMVITVCVLPDNSQHYADMVLGFLLGTVVATILTFFYGSSRGSQAKDQSGQTLTRMLQDAQIKNAP